MIRFDRCWIGWLAVALMLLPRTVWSQTTVRSVGGAEGSTFLAKANAFVTQAAPKTVGGGGLPRREKIIIGAAIGAGAGAVFGEYQFGRRMDMPHGPDMAFGAAIGAAVGAAIAALLTWDRSAVKSKPRQSASY